MENKLKTRKVFYIALSILVAVVIWVFVDLTGNNGGPFMKEKIFEDLPIVFEGEDELADQGLMLLPDGTDTTLDLTLEGTRWDIANVDREDISVKVDLGNIIATGSQKTTPVITFPNSGKFGRTALAATINIAELYRKTVDVRCELIGNVAEGYTAGQLQLSHTSIEIRGQKEDIDPVSYVKTTLDLGKDAGGTVSAELAYQFYDKDGQVIDNSSGRIHATVQTIQATLPVSVRKELPLKVSFVEYPGARAESVNWEISPKTIVVSGDAAKLKNVNAITVGELDLLSLNEGTGTYNFAITVPEGCQNLSGVTRATLKISYKDMASAEVTTEQFRCENVPAGKTVHVLTREMTVKIFGTAEDVAAVTGEDITLVADLSDYSAVSGGYTVPATVKVTSGGDVGVSGSYQIQITIRELEQEPEEPEAPEE